jgi:DNA replication protein DnaC
MTRLNQIVSIAELARTVTVTGNCDKHGPWEREVPEIMAARAKTCPKCTEEAKAEQMKQEQAAAAQQIEQAKQNRIESMLSRAGIPPRYENRTFDHFKVLHDRQGEIMARCKRYAENFPAVMRRGANLALIGNTGTGKTHLACAIATHIIRHHGRTAVFSRVMQVISSIQAVYKDRSKTLLEAISDWTHPDLLVIDEIGLQRGSTDEHLLLTELISQRHDLCKPTIILSNCDKNGLVQYLGERLVSRIEEDGGAVFVCDWPSYRPEVVHDTDLPRRELF